MANLIHLGDNVHVLCSRALGLSKGGPRVEKTRTKQKIYMMVRGLEHRFPRDQTRFVRSLPGIIILWICLHQYTQLVISTGFTPSLNWAILPLVSDSRTSPPTCIVAFLSRRLWRKNLKRCLKITCYIWTLGGRFLSFFSVNQQSNNQGEWTILPLCQNGNKKFLQRYQ